MKFSQIAILVCGLSTLSFAGVTVSSPTPNSQNQSSVHFAASASGNYPIVAMMIYSDNQSVYSVNAANINTDVSLANGTHYVVVQAWDNHNNVYKANGFNISVSGGNNNNATYQMIHAMSGWQSCGSCAGKGGHGPDTPRYMHQFIATPSMTGKASEYWIGPKAPYSGALWWKQLGANSKASHFVYDLYFYVKNPSAPQALEFDMNQSVNNRKFIFGTQCDIKGHKDWDVWDTAHSTWVKTGIACSAPPAYTWNHLVLEFARSGSQATFVSVTLNGKKSYINKTFNTFGVNASELNTAVQLDGNGSDNAYSMWVDKMQVTAW
ncbi:MAG: hypothetical protein WAM71_06825 [Candidatus Korobacteraceae bacterium]